MACELENFTKMVDSLANKAGLPANTRKELFSIKEYATTEMAKLMSVGTKAVADNKFTLIVTANPDKQKAPYKLSKANKYIGFGIGSTGSYASQLKSQGMPVNSGEYTSSDVVFSSINGKGKLTEEAFNQTLTEVKKALDSGAMVLTDSEAYTLASDYNVGEKRLRTALIREGYVYSTDPDQKNVGIWTSKNTVMFQKTDSDKLNTKLSSKESANQEADIIASSKEAEMAIPDEGC
jgi:predicted transcriptional regulator